MTDHSKVTLRGTGLMLCILSVFTALQTQATSLQDTYQLALYSDPLLQQSAAQLFNSRENIVQAKAALLPIITGQVQAYWQDSSISSTSKSTAYAINLSQSIYAPALSAAHQKVKILAQQSESKHLQNQQDLILRTAQTYIEAMLAQSNLTNSQAQERAIKQRLNRVNAEFEVGVIAITDVHEAKASFDNAQVDLIISEGALQNALEALQRLTGTNISEIDSLKPNYRAQAIAPNDLDYWVTRAIAGNLSIQRGQAAIESAHQDTNIATSAKKPSIDLQASHSRSNDNQYGAYTSNQVTLVLSMPLYNAGSLNSKVRQAMYSQSIAKSKQQDNIRAVTQQTRSLIRDIQTNVLAINARTQSILSSTAALDAVSAGFDLGTRNIVELLQAEQAVFNAKNLYASARLNHIKLNFKLKYQLGTLAISDLNEFSLWLTVTEKPSS